MGSSEDTKIINNSEIINCDNVLKVVIRALQDKGYNPITQLASYLLSGEPLYITGYNGARNLIQNIGREELLEYISSKLIREYGIYNKDWYVYDLDGTLVDTEEDTRLWCCKHIRMITPEEWAEHCVGVDWYKILEYMSGKALSEEEKEKLTRSYNKEFEFKYNLNKLDYKKNDFLVKKIKEHDYNIIVTAREEEQAKMILKYLEIEDRIDKIYCGDKEGKILKSNNIKEVMSKYNVVKVYDDINANLLEYLKYDRKVKTFYIKHKYNKPEEGITMMFGTGNVYMYGARKREELVANE